MTVAIWTIIYLYLLFGILMSSKSESRGWKADLLFVFTWGLHLYWHWRGRE